MIPTTSWSQKTVVVTGVGKGLGAALAGRFAREGARVAMLARSQAVLEEIASEAQDLPGTLHPFPCDLSDGDAIAKTFDLIRHDLGPVHSLIHNAGMGGWKGLLDGSSEDFEKGWRVTTFGAYLCAKAAVSDILEAEGGVMLFTGATSSIRGRGSAVGFSSAKFGLRGLAQSLAVELWPKKIHVAHIIIDGLIDVEQSLAAGSYGDEKNPMMRPDDIAESYWMLANQAPSAWSLELDLRPRSEEFFS